MSNNNKKQPLLETSFIIAFICLLSTGLVSNGSLHLPDGVTFVRPALASQEDNGGLGPNSGLFSRTFEVCDNGIDDDGDGTVDEEDCVIPEVGETVPTPRPTPRPSPPVASIPDSPEVEIINEICGNGFDDDGDGMTDEQDCTTPSLTPGAVPTDPETEKGEACNFRDDDGDGTVDEFCPPPPHPPTPQPPTSPGGDVGGPQDGGVFDPGNEPTTPPGSEAGGPQDGAGIEQPQPPSQDPPPDSTTTTPPQPPGQGNGDDTGNGDSDNDNNNGGQGGPNFQGDVGPPQDGEVEQDESDGGDGGGSQDDGPIL